MVQLPVDRRSPVCRSWWLHTGVRKNLYQLDLEPVKRLYTVTYVYAYQCFLARFWACWAYWWSPPDVAALNPHMVAFLPLQQQTIGENTNIRLDASSAHSQDNKRQKLKSNTLLPFCEMHQNDDISNKYYTHPFAWKSLRWPRWHCYTQK